MSLYKISYYPEPNGHIRNKTKFELDLHNYPRKFDIKNAASFDIRFRYGDLVNLKTDILIS